MTYPEEYVWHATGLSFLYCLEYKEERDRVLTGKQEKITSEGNPRQPGDAETRLSQAAGRLAFWRKSLTEAEGRVGYVPENGNSGWKQPRSRRKTEHERKKETAVTVGRKEGEKQS